MMAVLGEMPRQLLDAGQYASRYFDHEGKLLVPSPFPQLDLENLSDYSEPDKKEYLDFIRSMVCLLPERRCSASALLKLPWLCN